MKQVLARAMIWTTFESVSVTLVALGTLIGYAYFLTPQQLGEGALAVSIVQLLVVPTETIFQSALIQRREADARDYGTGLTASLALAAIFIALSVPGGMLFARWMAAPDVAWLLPVTAVSLVFCAASVPLVARRRRELDFQPLAVRTVFARLAGGVAGIAGAVLGAGAWALVLQQVVYLVLAYLLLRLQTADAPRPAFSRRSFREMVRIGTWPAFGYLLAIAAPKVFTVFIGVVFGSAAAGFANLAFRAIDTARDVIGAAVGQVLLPVLSKAERETGRSGAMTLTGTSLVCAVTFPMFFGGAVTAPELIELLFGAQWREAVPLFAAHSLSMAYHFALIVVSALMTTLGQPARMLPGLAMQSLAVAVATAFAGLGDPGSIAATMALIWVLRVVVAMPVDAVFLKGALKGDLGAFALRPLRYAAHGTAMAGAVLLAAALLGEGLSTLALLALKIAVGAVTVAVTYLLFERALIGRLIELLKLGFGRKKTGEQA